MNRTELRSRLSQQVAAQAVALSKSGWLESSVSLLPDGARLGITNLLDRVSAHEEITVRVTKSQDVVICVNGQASHVQPKDAAEELLDAVSRATLRIMDRGAEPRSRDTNERDIQCTHSD